MTFVFHKLKGTKGSVQFGRSSVWLFATPWTTAHQASLSITNSQSLPKLMSIESVMPSNYLILCHPLFLLPSIFPSIRVFSNKSALRIRWPKHWSFSLNISPSNEHPGLIPFRTDWLDLLAVQGTLKSLLQHHSSKASILWHSAFFIVQLSHPYMTTRKTIALTRRTFVDKVMSLIKVYPYINIEWSESSSVVSDSLQPCRLYSPWNSPGRNTGVGSLSLLQGIFLTQGLNPGLLHCRRILYQLSYQGTALKFPSS